MKKLSLRLTHVFLMLTIFGLLVSIFLWSSTYSREVRYCLTGGCESVLLSPYARIFSVPISVWGAMFYSVGVLVSIFRLLDDRPVLRIFIWLYSTFSVLASIYFFYLELFKIHAICSWCKLSTITSIILLFFAVKEFKRYGGFANLQKEIKTLFTSV